MYSGTGVCVGHAHWPSRTLWKCLGLEMSVGAIRPLLRAAISLACIAPIPLCFSPTTNSTRLGCVIPTSTIVLALIFPTVHKCLRHRWYASDAALCAHGIVRCG